MNYGQEYVEVQKNEYEANRRDEKYDQAQDNEVPLLKKLMPDFDKYFATDERHEKHVLDAKHGL